MELSHFQNRKCGTDYMTPRHFPESLSSCILLVTVYAMTVLNKDAVAPVIIVYYNRGLRELHISRKKGHCFKNDHSRGRSIAEFVFSRQRIDSNLLRNFWKNQLDWVTTEIGSINPGTRSALRGSAITGCICQPWRCGETICRSQSTNQVLYVQPQTFTNSSLVKH